VIMNQAMRAMVDEKSRPELADWILGKILKSEDTDQEIQIEHRWILISAHGLRTSEGFLEGALVIATDVTEIKQAQGRIARSLGVEAEGRLAGESPTT